MMDDKYDMMTIKQLMSYGKHATTKRTCLQRLKVDSHRYRPMIENVSRDSKHSNSSAPFMGFLFALLWVGDFQFMSPIRTWQS